MATPASCPSSRTPMENLCPTVGLWWRWCWRTNSFASRRETGTSDSISLTAHGVTDALHDIRHTGYGHAVAEHLVTLRVADGPAVRAGLRPAVRVALQTLRLGGGEPPHAKPGADGVLVVQRVAAGGRLCQQCAADLIRLPEVAAVHGGGLALRLICPFHYGHAALVAAGVPAVQVQRPGGVRLIEAALWVVRQHPAGMVGADHIGFHHGALLARQEGGGGLLLETDAPGLAAGLVLEARAHHAEVQLVPLSGRAGKTSAGGTERPGDLGVGDDGLFLFSVIGLDNIGLFADTVERGRQFPQDLRMALTT